MAEPHVSLDATALSPAAERLRGPLEAQLTSALQAAADKVRARYDGQDVEQVMTALVDQTRAGLHPDIAAGFQPDPGELRTLADTIVREHS